ncbi:hypothetical protein [Desulfoscipio gibsoniae]|uniref:Uncharacterized protein n=1 Tax=Desulfoscipio gibsoniae DSM 7213 TaxID=767817 RepID=R4KLZ6_9FIRM|nr:hypothetical protein [Desulfoscipio gibsoniae]AGL00666.1 hypothetical protein Desgi_1142 [Desulfoscipio gibsoniae DSM 7213]
MRRNDLVQHPLNLAIDAINRGNQENALVFTRQIWEEGRPLHDLYGDMAGLFCTYIADKLGEEAVEDAWRFVGEQLWRPLLMYIKDNGGTKALVDIYAAFLRSHGHDFYVEQDDEKTVFVMKYCASGGRMIKEGKNDNSNRHSVNIGTTRKKYPWGFNMEGLSYYCVHTPLWMDILPREWGWDVFKSEFGRQFDELGNPVDEPCKATIYHKPRS